MDKNMDRASLAAMFLNDARNLIVEKYDTDAGQLQRAVIIVEKFAVDPDKIGKTGALGEAVVCLRDAPTYTTRDAQALARRIVNGAGVKGRAMILADAYDEAIAEYRKLAATLSV